MGLVPNATGQQVEKRANRCEVQKYFAIGEKITFPVINVIRYQLKPLKCSFISTLEAIETCHYPIFDCAKFQSFEAKTDIKIKLQPTGKGLWLVFTGTELQIDRKTI